MIWFGCRLWSLVDRALVMRASVESPARSCAFNGDGTQIAVGCKNGTFVVFRVL